MNKDWGCAACIKGRSVQVTTRRGQVLHAPLLHNLEGAMTSLFTLMLVQIIFVICSSEITFQLTLRITTVSLT